MDTPTENVIRFLEALLSVVIASSQLCGVPLVFAVLNQALPFLFPVVVHSEFPIAKLGSTLDW